MGAQKIPWIVAKNLKKNPHSETEVEIKGKQQKLAIQDTSTL